MQPFRRGVLACALVATLALSMSAAASDREAGPRGPGQRSPISRVIAFIIHTLDDISFPRP
jgi:hypothetical protein